MQSYKNFLESSANFEYYFDNAKEKLSKSKEIHSSELDKNRRGDKFIIIHYTPKTSPQTSQKEWVKVFYSTKEELEKIYKELPIKK